MDLRDFAKAQRKEAQRALDKRRMADPNIDDRLPPVYVAYASTDRGRTWNVVGIVQLRAPKIRDLEPLRRELGVPEAAGFKLECAATAIFRGPNHSTSSLLGIDA